MVEILIRGVSSINKQCRKFVTVTLVVVVIVVVTVIRVRLSYKSFTLKDLQIRVIPAKAGIHNTKLTCKRLDP